ncbi:hypothetical protein ACFRJ1_16115 [Streptomyces sp. NPDC056773]|uniref:hypothetical protein n=1 Tax=unclassified Streptomyces TaxID=2593676 RepID=UPI0036B40B03
MGQEATTAAMGAAGAVAGAALTGMFTVRGARRQAAAAVQAGLAQAASAYLGPLDTARRAAQREAYVRLLTDAQGYAAEVRPVLRLARAMDRAAGNTARRSRRDAEVEAAAEADYRERIAAVNRENPVASSVQHVELEGPPEVAETARQIHAAATALFRTLRRAGYCDAGGGEEPIQPDRERSFTRHEELLTAIERFTQVAQEHLNRRDHPRSDEQSRRWARVPAFFRRRRAGQTTA